MELEQWHIDNELPLFDFPLDFEVVTMGEYYIDPAVSDSILTFRYASIPDDGRNLPSVSYVVLENLYLEDEDPFLLAESFEINGYEERINDDLLFGGIFYKELQSMYKESGGNFPSFIPGPIECPEGCDPKLIYNPNGSPNGFLEWVCDCTPPPGPTLNKCGCAVPSNIRIPAGCVEVEGQLSSKDAVANTRIAIIDSYWPFFRFDIQQTNVDGCWEADKEFGKKVWVYNFFANGTVKVRNWHYWAGLRIMVDFVKRFDNPPYNNLYTFYADDSNTSSKGKQYWASSHSLNVVNQYHINAGNDNIPLPRTKLNWLNIGSDSVFIASAPMLQGNNFNSWPAWIAAFIYPPLYFGTSFAHPDIINTYGGNTSSRAFNGTAFHEIGHASHHSIVGESYWVNYRNHIINNSLNPNVDDPYGFFGNFANNSHEGHIALGEAIGNFTGNKYGSTAAGGENFEWENNFIPRGLLFDLDDFSPSEIITDPNNSASGFDIISGFTPEMMFDALNSNVTSIRDYRESLRNLHLNNTPNSTTDFNSFLDLYDVFN